MNVPDISPYQTRLDINNQMAKSLSKRYDLISVGRFILFAAAIYCLFSFFFQSGHRAFLLATLLLIVGFVVLFRYHTTIAWKRDFHRALAAVNQDEITILTTDENPYDNGNRFKPSKHDYALDLDIISDHSIYQFINRTGLWQSRKALATRLLDTTPAIDIAKRQEAIQELSGKIDWRQKLAALTRMTADSEKKANSLQTWMEEKVARPSTIIYWLAITFVVGFIASLLIYVVSGSEMAYLLLKWLFIINLGLTSSQVRTVQKMLFYSTALVENFHQLGQISAHIEQATFTSPYLKELQSKLVINNHAASAEIKKIASLFRQLDSIQNPFAAIVMNGIGCYHLFVKQGIDRWRNQHAMDIDQCLQVAAEFEITCSLGNMYFNYPSFTFPTISSTPTLSFKDAGHPLISSTVCVYNSVSFEDIPFVILTGSNMAGKSTFLRTLGVNIVLGKIGAPVCAREAIIYPFQLLVSMRLNDSLADDESYFFAEVKRLKYISEAVAKTPSFVLLDEILRGTNSDDKRSGTIAYIKKLAKHDLMGCIATHDLAVCETAHDLPQKLTNKCFEVEVINNELVFDYALRDGICQSKSATFLMNKMGIIDGQDV